jgi:hypothetical protein
MPCTLRTLYWRSEQVYCVQIEAGSLAAVLRGDVYHHVSLFSSQRFQRPGGRSTMVALTATSGLEWLPRLVVVWPRRKQDARAPKNKQDTQVIAGCSPTGALGLTLLHQPPQLPGFRLKPGLLFVIVREATEVCGSGQGGLLYAMSSKAASCLLYAACSNCNGKGPGPR